MVDSIRIKEIHACLGAKEFATWDNNGVPTDRHMHMARVLDKVAKAIGVMFKPDGQVMAIRKRVEVPYKEVQGSAPTATIPDGWLRGQFADNTGGITSVENGMLGGDIKEERLGIAYQNRCNTYSKYDPAKPEEDKLMRGSIILCENWMQYIESYLEDMDKGLNWQEMGDSVLPSADRSSSCRYSGMGSLLAEVAYMLSQLSSNIYQSHSLDMQTHHNSLQILKAIGLPMGVNTLEIDTGECDEVTKKTIKGRIPLPVVVEDSLNLTQQNFAILQNIALLLGNLTPPPTPDVTTPPPPPTP